MKIKDFIKSVKEFLELDNFKEEKKKKAIKKLLKKLLKRKKELDMIEKDTLKNKEKKALKEELEIVKYQIKKGAKLLKKLKEKKQGDSDGK